MGVQFDDGAAGALVSAARRADRVLGEQGAGRRGAAETAAQEFRGGYAGLFTAACEAEATDRGRLGRAFDSLAQQVEQARQQAAEERARLADLDAWQSRDADRAERRDDDPVQWVATTVEDVLDPRPSAPPVQPPTISIAFSAAQRDRLTVGVGSGTSSAVPGDLRIFADHARAADSAARAEVDLVADAWTRFVASCSWVATGGASFVDGARGYLDENDADAVWIGHVADAFEQAGGGTMTNRSLDLFVSAFIAADSTDATTVLAHMDPEVAAAWLAVNPQVLDGFLTTPPAWGTPASVFDALVAAARAGGTAPADYADLLQRMYVTRAAEKVGIDMGTWQLDRGAPALMPQVAGSYEYYASLYLDNPDFTWAGMANMVGPDFAAGFLDLHSFRDHIATAVPFAPPSTRALTDQLAEMSDDEIAFYERTFLDMQRDIFLDASTMHEAYLDGGMGGIRELREAGLLMGANPDQDAAERSEDETFGAWLQIDAGMRNGQQELVDQGNRSLLLREQRDTIQQNYTDMRNHAPTGEALTRMLGIVGDASIPDTKTLGQYEGGVPVPVDLVPTKPGVQGWVDHLYLPEDNIADFDTRWGYIEGDTLPAWQQLVHDDPDRARELVGASVPDRIADRRLDERAGELLGNLYEREYTWQ